MRFLTVIIVALFAYFKDNRSSCNTIVRLFVWFTGSLFVPFAVPRAIAGRRNTIHFSPRRHTIAVFYVVKHCRLNVVIFRFFYILTADI